ncbi:MAG: bacillithiol biosynthesis deacetylase BshB1 [Salibacter sp.]|uniref:bacillithiol biosynthesis deacetylase BshB1 n=1 Tax=Salibacter sp. TaxID=2010995 RepID=UPI002870755C|nr:bacillithiol biosynthesis deacetylase BshB1 [Salibacter sp.]MDR9397713.1 bacillithiol biosynthesis deacetylase BshB1 [Salibacter sp.]
MTKEKVDILAIAAHPDDVELSCSGTIIKHVKQGKKAAVVDLTKGELGTRGTPELRMEEAEKASEIMGVSYRENLSMDDGFFQYNKENIIKIATQIRRFQPEIALINTPEDRHPDHGRAAKLIADACFYSGLRKIKMEWDGEPLEPWRPKAVYHYIQDRYLQPDFVVDISAEWDTKLKAIAAFSSQFFSEKSDSKEPETPISSQSFIDFLEGRAAQYGRSINAKYAEGFIAARTPGVDDITSLL